VKFIRFTQGLAVERKRLGLNRDDFVPAPSAIAFTHDVG